MADVEKSLRENPDWFIEPKSFFCPACWGAFGLGSVMNIRSSATDRHDPILGPGHPERFYPRRFDANGGALDSEGNPSFDLACPHCRRKLPQGYCEKPHHIFSLVGAPGAGKSYYLSVLIDVLQKVLYEDFGITFRDEDPSGNVLLNEMKNRLLSAQSAEEAILDKTTLEGKMYEQLQYMGRESALPKPFVYTMTRRDEVERSASLILYDNAGEHFQPNIDIDHSPGALHVAHSSALLFLYNPATNPGFRKALSHVDDPQLNQTGVPDTQDVLIAEMETRMRRIRGLSSNVRISTPLAVVVGKADLWRSLVDWDAFRPPVLDGAISHENVQANSALLRTLLLKHAPGVVANAESLSTEVAYFAASGLGHSPKLLRSGPMEGYLAPDPRRLRPQYVEVPVLWALSHCAYNLIPSGA
ncbi:MAG: hypothetical protein MK080_06660 [Opitutales bacterium]|nr:hypothetical protein [Opitutales bacterium]NRA25719.1 hypothetical protein [Opitutales bacterium]